MKVCNKDVTIELSTDEIQKLLFCIDLVIQNFGENKSLDEIYDKLIILKKV